MTETTSVGAETAGWGGKKTLLLSLVLVGAGLTAVVLLRAATLPRWEPVREPEQVRFEESRFDRKPDMFLSVIDPDVVPALQASLHDDAEVLGLVVDGESRAYDALALSYHHVVNDMLAGRPVAMTYCLICSAGIAFERESAGRVLTFGYHGIWNGTAVLYDHQTQSKWLQISGECIEGELKGQTLRPIACRHTSWKEWRKEHPDGTLMQTLSKYANAYFPRNQALRGSDFFPPNFPPTIKYRDPRLPANALCSGIRVGSEARAYPYSTLSQIEEGVVNDVLGGKPIVVVFNRDSQSFAAFDRQFQGKTLNLHRSSQGYLRDEETGKEFDWDGRALNDPTPSRLTTLYALQSEWYGWAAVWPETSIWSPDKSL